MSFDIKSKKSIVYILILLIVTVAAIILFFTLSSSEEEQPVESVEAAENVAESNILEYGIPVSEYDVKEDVVRNGDFFSTILSRVNVPQSTVYELTQKCKDVFDVRKVKVGNRYKTYFTRDSIPKAAYLVYERDNISYALFGLKDSLYVKIFDKKIETELRYAEVTINNSLWVDLKSAGLTPILALKLSEIYAWSIDFFGLQKGDSFRVLYEVMTYKGDILDVDRVVYCVFNHAGKEFPVYYYEEEGTGNRYWNDKGESMRKAFLKAPLSFTRISSGFSYARRHPITRKVRPHTGIDYAAPKGTPVMSIGDGVVVEKGYKGAGGNTVKIKHNSVYTSAYLHLSKYGKGISVGTRVSQGQVIGYVGSTGSSTGPHLDFRIWKNGSPINPLKMESPPAYPIKKENMERFLSSQKRSEAKVDSLFARQFFDKTIDFVR